MLQKAFVSIRSVFRQYDVDNSGAIDPKELGACMRALGAHLPDKELKEMFEFANMSSSGSLSFKEFLLCLAIGSVLQLFPLLRAYSGLDLRKLASGTDFSSSAKSVGSEGSTGDGPAGGRGGGGGDGESPEEEDLKRSALYGPGRRLVAALRLVLEAYILFDADGSGTIDRNEVLAIVDEENRKASETHGLGKIGSGVGKARMKESAPKDGTSSLLSRERWQEMDWDSDGKITFKEFLFALMNWVGMDDEDEDDEEDDELDSHGAGSRVSEAHKLGSHASEAEFKEDAKLEEQLRIPPRLSHAAGGSVRQIDPAAIAALSESAAAAAAGLKAAAEGEGEGGEQAAAAGADAAATSGATDVTAAPPGTVQSSATAEQRGSIEGSAGGSAGGDGGGGGGGEEGGSIIFGHHHTHGHGKHVKMASPSRPSGVAWADGGDE